MQRILFRIVNKVLHTKPDRPPKYYQLLTKISTIVLMKSLVKKLNVHNGFPSSILSRVVPLVEVAHVQDGQHMNLFSRLISDRRGQLLFSVKLTLCLRGL